MTLVPSSTAKSIAPFSLGGQSRWTNMMWLEFLLRPHRRSRGVPARSSTARRTRGPTPLDQGRSPRSRTLVKANGFVKGFSSITADSNADQALLYTGKAAMMLHGSWTYGTMKATAATSSPAATSGT